MIYKGSIVKVVDNSGARFVRCINIVGKSYKSKANVGGVILVSLKKIIPNKKVKRGTLYKAVVVRLNTKVMRFGGTYLQFETSAVVLLNTRQILLGTRVLGPVSLDLRKLGFFKIISLAPAVF